MTGICFFTVKSVKKEVKTTKYYDILFVKVLQMLRNSGIINLYICVKHREAHYEINHIF